MKTIIQRELMEHLKSIQFIVLLSVSVVLFFANGVIFVKKYDQVISPDNPEAVETYQKPSTTSTMLSRQKSPLLFISEGGDKYRPFSYRLQPKGVLLSPSAGPRNYKLPEIPELDWAFIIKIIFSLYVLFLGYQAVCGEKEQGTLRQILSNPFGRIKLLVAKYVSILLSVTVPLAIGCLISLIIVGFSAPQVFTLSNVLRIALMLFISLVYLSVFAFLSLLLSSRIYDSSLVLMVLLAVWILFGIVIPNTSGIISERISNVPSEYQTAKQEGPMIQQQVWARIGRVIERVKQGELRTEEEVKQETDRAFDEGQEDLINLKRSYENSMIQLATTAKNISRLSPTALFQYASENIAGTGSNWEKHFKRDARAYSAIYDDYILKKVGKLVGISEWSFSTSITINEKYVYIRSPRPEEYRGDMSDFPYFVPTKFRIKQGLRDALFDLAGLLLWNIVLAMGAIMSILRTDVR